MVSLQNKLKKKVSTLNIDNNLKKHNFSRLWRIKEAQDRSERYAKNLDTRKKQRLRDSLDIGKKVLVSAERLKKKDAPGILYKSTTENRPYFNKNIIFTINKHVLTGDNTYYYWLKETAKKLKTDF